MLSWKTWYPNIDGFFIDNYSSNPTYYSSQLTDFARKTLGVKYLVGNPGTSANILAEQLTDYLITSELNGSMPTLPWKNPTTGNLSSYISYNITSFPSPAPTYVDGLLQYIANSTYPTLSTYLATLLGDLEQNN